MGDQLRMSKKHPCCAGYKAQVGKKGMDRIDHCLGNRKELFICRLDYDLIGNKPSLRKSRFNYQAHVKAGQAGISVNFKIGL